MKTSRTFLFLIFTIIITSCSSKKVISSNPLYIGAWEMEFISGPRIAFEALYPNKKPTITFDKTSQKVSGSTSCNSYNAPFTTDNSTINFGEAGPTTRMFCGQGEQLFLTTIQKVDHYMIDKEGKLNLMIGSVSVMRFKNTKTSSR